MPAGERMIAIIVTTTTMTPMALVAAWGEGVGTGVGTGGAGGSVQKMRYSASRAATVVSTHIHPLPPQNHHHTRQPRARFAILSEIRPAARRCSAGALLPHVPVHFPDHQRACPQRTRSRVVHRERAPCRPFVFLHPTDFSCTPTSWPYRLCTGGKVPPQNHPGCRAHRVVPEAPGVR
jgi:hypothetical protein